MREGWKEFALNELGFVGRGKSRHRPRNAEFLYGGEYPFIQTGDVEAAEFYINSYSKTYSEEGLKQSKLWNKNTLCISIVGANTGASGLLKFDACFPDSVIGFVADEKLSDVKFVKYQLELNRRKLKQVSEGAARENLSLEKLLSLKFLLPPLEAQKKITSILSGYDDLIENNLKRIKILEEMARQTYEEWFVCMRFPGHEDAIINKETGLPEGWEKVRMGEILYFTNGFAFKSKDYVENGIYSILTIKNVQEGYFEDSKFDKILEVPSKVKDSQRLKTGDLVMSLTGNVGRLCFVYGENLMLNQRVCKIDSETIGFVYCTLRSANFKNKIENLANGVAQQNLSTIDMENLIIDFPKNELLDEFEVKTNLLFKSILNLNIQNQRLREARDILLPRLMMGMIEV